MADFNMFHYIVNVIYLAVPPLALVLVLDAIVTNDILKQYYFLTVHMCICFLLFSFLFTLSQVCTLHRKPEAVSKPLSRLYDSDLESDDETEVVEGEEINPLLSIMENFFLFCHFRHIYGVIAVVGSLLLIPVLVSLTTWYFSEACSLEDVGSAFAVLAVAAIFLECVVLLVANVPEFYSCTPLVTSYKPFDEIIRVPMKIFATKVLALYVENIFRFVANLFYQFSAIYGLIVVCNMPEKEIRKFEEASEAVKLHTVMVVMMAAANICGFFIMFECFWTPCLLTKEKLLMTFEKNWERNLRAFDFLLPEKEVATLEELRDALLDKSSQEDLTEEEQKTLQYIERPLWKTKRVFLDKPKGIAIMPRVRLNESLYGLPDNSSSSRQVEDTPSASSRRQSVRKRSAH